jgi:hypothetical protein
MRALAWTGQYERVFDMTPALLGESGRSQWVLGALAWTYGKAGRRDLAGAVFAELEARSKHEFTGPFWMAVAAASAGLEQPATRCLERAVLEFDPIVNWSRVVPFADELRRLPRYREIVLPLWS